MRRNFFTRMALTVVVMGGAMALSARAADWPLRPVRIVTSFPVGSGGDVSARLYAEGLGTRWGKPVVVENKPGADGIIAVTAFLNARDEHTLLYINGGPVTTNPFSHDKLPYDPAADLLPISSGADVFIALSAPASMNIDSLTGFVRYARSQPNKLNWGATQGALDYLIPGFLKGMGLDMVHVSYREIAPALNDLAEGRIHLYASALATQLPVVRSGKAKILAITNRDRAPLAPDVETVVEAGFADLSFEAFLGFFGPKDMPPEQRDRISADLRAVAADPAIGARLSGAGLIVRTNTPAEFAVLIERERSKIERLARVVNIKPAQ